MGMGGGGSRHHQQSSSGSIDPFSIDPEHDITARQRQVRPPPQPQPIPPQQQQQYQPLHPSANQQYPDFQNGQAAAAPAPAAAAPPAAAKPRAPAAPIRADVVAFVPTSTLFRRHQAPVAKPRPKAPPASAAAATASTSTASQGAASGMSVSSAYDQFMAELGDFE